MIPRRFFWLFDVLMLGLAFVAAYALVPVLHALMAAGQHLAFAVALFILVAGGRGRGNCRPWVIWPGCI